MNCRICGGPIAKLSESNLIDGEREHAFAFDCVAFCRSSDSRGILPKLRNSDEEARKIIGDLLDAGSTDVLVTHQDGGQKVDVIYSRIRGKTDEVMGLAEMERITDAAIRRAWEALTGKAMPRGVDPVQFINDEGEHDSLAQGRRRRKPKARHP